MWKTEPNRTFDPEKLKLKTHTHRVIFAFIRFQRVTSYKLPWKKENEAVYGKKNYLKETHRRGTTDCKTRWREGGAVMDGRQKGKGRKTHTRWWYSDMQVELQKLQEDRSRLLGTCHRTKTTYDIAEHFVGRQSLGNDKQRLLVSVLCTKKEKALNSCSLWAGSETETRYRNHYRGS